MPVFDGRAVRGRLPAPVDLPPGEGQSARVPALRSSPQRVADGARRPAFGLLFALAASLFSCSPASVEEEGAPPNIVLILADDLGYNDVSFHGATEIETPHLDALARSGVIFTNGYVAAPTCGPSRVGLMTGRYPARSGSEFNWAFAPFDTEHGLPVEERTFARRLQQAGYHTGLVGKWHLGAARPFHPLHRGFDEFFGFLAGDREYFRTETSRWAPWSRIPLLDGQEATEFEGYLTDALTDRAVDFVSGDRTAPFFLFLSYNAPHAPLEAPSELIEKYAHLADEDRRNYLAMVDSLDAGVGRVLDALEATGQRRNTLVFFLSDNGGVYPWPGWPELDWADNAPLRAGKTSFHEGGIRVPFAASWPERWPAGTTFDPMVIALDIAATALSAAGAAGDAGPPLDGVDLDPFVRGETPGPPHEALFWRLWRGRDTGYAVRAGDRKLVRTPGGSGELFDLRVDPGETRDLSATEPETVERLAARWNDWNRSNRGPRFIHGGLYRSALAQKRTDLAETGEIRGAAAPFQIGAPDRRSDCASGAPAAAGRPGGLVTDCVALTTLRDALLGGGGLDWSPDRPLRRWAGVTLGGQPERVLEVKLPGRGIEGRVPVEIGEMNGLEVLDLSGNRLGGELPPGLGRLGRLRVLDLSGNELTGALPAGLGAARSLNELSLRDNAFTGAIPPELGEASRLRLLRLAGNDLSGCVPPSLMRVESHDLDELGLPPCDP